MSITTIINIDNCKGIQVRWLTELLVPDVEWYITIIILYQNIDNCKGIQVRWSTELLVPVVE